MAKYQVIITDNAGTPLADLTGRYTNLVWSRTRNRSDKITMQFNADDLKAYADAIGSEFWDLFRVARNQIQIYRNATLVCAGEITLTSLTLENIDTAFSVTALGWLALFNSRFTGDSRIFTGVDAGTIAWTLIDESQALTNGDYGITQGTIQVSKSRDRDYSLKNISDAIIQLAEVVDGFDFEFTPAKVFNVYYPKIGTTLTDYKFQLPGNVRHIDFDVDGTLITNAVTARGQGTGPNAIMGSATDGTSQAVHKLRQAFVEFPDVVLADTIQEHADEELRLFTAPFSIPRVTVDITSDTDDLPFGIGDTVEVQALPASLFSPVNDWFRIEQIEISVTNEDAETAQVSLARV